MNLFEIAAILTLCVLGWLAFGRTRNGPARWTVLVVGALLLVRALTG